MFDPRFFRWHDATGDHELALVWVAATEGDAYRFGHGGNRRGIEIPGFFMATTPVTQALWQRVMGTGRSPGQQDPSCPADQVSWQHITDRGGFLDRLNASEALAAVSDGDPGWTFRLPSETEWEYAARGGPHWRDDYRFSGSNDPDAVAWYGRRWHSGHQMLVRLFGWPVAWRLVHRIPRIPWPTRTHPVATKAPNQLGLYDMSGNVWEWCQDVCTDEIASIPADGAPYAGPGEDRRLRGGCHHNWDLHCTVWWRYGIQPDAHDGCIGFRVVLARAATIR
jgi:formylglycine-generating enzyme required for sulfatase activity